MERKIVSIFYNGGIEDFCQAFILHEFCYCFTQDCVTKKSWHRTANPESTNPDFFITKMISYYLHLRNKSVNNKLLFVKKSEFVDSGFVVKFHDFFKHILI